MLCRSIKYIQQKSHEDICIYFDSKSKTIKNSTEIKHNCHISSCLKHNIEKWLQSALEYDPTRRGISDDSKQTAEYSDGWIFKQLQHVLNKKIITVFSVYTYEFYYYEVNDYTLLSTIKNWIARDIKIPREDLVVLIANENYDIAEDDKIAVKLCDVSRLRSKVHAKNKTCFGC